MVNIRNSRDTSKKTDGDPERNKLKIQLDLAVNDLIHLRREYIDEENRVINATSREVKVYEEGRRGIRLSSILYQMREIISRFYLPYVGFVKIEFSRRNHIWLPIGIWKIEFTSDFINSNERTKAFFIKNVDDFLVLMKRGVHGTDPEGEEEAFQALKYEVEELIERFKSILVSDVFL